MITYNEAFNDGYEQALEEMGYVIDDREYAEEGLYDLDSFIDDNSAYENYDIDEAYYNGYYDALEALNLFKKKEPEPEPKKSIGSKILQALKSVVEKAIKLITETVPNFFRKLFGKDPKYKNDPRVKDINNKCKDLDRNARKGATILKGAGIVLGGVAAGYFGGRLLGKAVSKTEFGKNLGDNFNKTSYRKGKDENGKTKFYKEYNDTVLNKPTSKIYSKDENGNIVKSVGGTATQTTLTKQINPLVYALSKGCKGLVNLMGLFSGDKMSKDDIVAAQTRYVSPDNEDSLKHDKHVNAMKDKLRSKGFTETSHNVNYEYTPNENPKNATLKFS